jgi:hypothetical protein
VIWCWKIKYLAQIKTVWMRVVASGLSVATNRNSAFLFGSRSGAVDIYNNIETLGRGSESPMLLKMRMGKLYCKTCPVWSRLISPPEPE